MSAIEIIQTLLIIALMIALWRIDKKRTEAEIHFLSLYEESLKKNKQTMELVAESRKTSRIARDAIRNDHELRKFMSDLLRASVEYIQSEAESGKSSSELEKLAQAVSLAADKMISLPFPGERDD